jgi:hypothetical protein
VPPPQIEPARVVGSEAGALRKTGARDRARTGGGTRRGLIDHSSPPRWQEKTNPRKRAELRSVFRTGVDAGGPQRSWIRQTALPEGIGHARAGGLGAGPYPRFTKNLAVELSGSRGLWSAWVGLPPVP